jgi:hypothetical protein
LSTPTTSCIFISSFLERCYTNMLELILSNKYIFAIALPLLLLGYHRFIFERRKASNNGHIEPPYIRSWIPLIGHIIGMARWGAKYFEIVK